MPDPSRAVGERRLDLWRRAILLFDKTTQEHGPFHSAGYTDFVLEPTLDNDTNPDLVGASSAFFVVCELSVSPTKDLSTIGKYSEGALTPLLRGMLGGGERGGGASPFFVTTESGWHDFPRTINGINVSPSGGTYLASVTDSVLRESLDTWTGFASPPPSYGLSAVPESDPQEIKPALAGVVRLAAARGGSLAAEVAARHLSGDLWISFTPRARRILTDKVATLLEQAASYFEEDAHWDSSTKALSIVAVSTSAGRRAMDRRIAAWLGTRFIEEWLGEEEDEEFDSQDDEPEDQQ